MFRFPWFEEAPGELAGVALAEELVENIANFLFTAALPFFTFLCRPKQQRFWIFERFPQESWVKTLCFQTHNVDLWHLFDGFPRAWEARRQVKTTNFCGNCDDLSYFTDDYLHVGGWQSTDIWVDRMCAFKEFKISQMFKSCTMGPKIAFIRLQPNPASSEATVQSSDQTDHPWCTWGSSCQAVDLGISFTESEKGCGLEIPRCTIQTNCETIINHAYGNFRSISLVYFTNRCFPSWLLVKSLE